MCRSVVVHYNTTKVVTNFVTKVSLRCEQRSSLCGTTNLVVTLRGDISNALETVSIRNPHTAQRASIEHSRTEVGIRIVHTHTTHTMLITQTGQTDHGVGPSGLGSSG